ncbi:hypothetical protein D7X94_13230 [Acutalibacter sp. 1XD8-33]|uniref:anti-sigma-I factor RsgI family protein n=1 Tax=Acutalibacter sp. 1XD8-33 TaxID=2320081 RepID=UPI000EA30CC8|nr:hypothetical protein [Acutalibacter sp. 1XD8-33]RKJ39193.1 hypothetical protein D7X94_13230 [Acutalibacter sp. 1XD8-33]
MNNRLGQAFDQIHTPEDLKSRTEELLSLRISKGSVPPKRIWRYAAAVFCMLILAVGALGGWLYFTPVSAISIDINPSLELNINCFDQVVSVDGFNEEGRALAESLELRFIDYASAIDLLLSEQGVESYLKQGEGLSILVVCDDPERSEKMLATVENCTEAQRHVHCHSEGSENAGSAHAAGLSCGKYRAYLELYAVDPSITPQDVQDLTIREIREWTWKLSGITQNSSPENDENTGSAPKADATPEATASSPEPSSANGHNGSGQGHGHGHGKGKHRK